MREPPASYAYWYRASGLRSSSTWVTTVSWSSEQVYEMASGGRTSAGSATCSAGKASSGAAVVGWSAVAAPEAATSSPVRSRPRVPQRARRTIRVTTRARTSQTHWVFRSPASRRRRRASRRSPRSSAAAMRCRRSSASAIAPARARLVKPASVRASSSGSRPDLSSAIGTSSAGCWWNRTGARPSGRPDWHARRERGPCGRAVRSCWGTMGIRRRTWH